MEPSKKRERAEVQKVKDEIASKKPSFEVGLAMTQFRK